MYIKCAYEEISLSVCISTCLCRVTYASSLLHQFIRQLVWYISSIVSWNSGILRHTHAILKSQKFAHHSLVLHVGQNLGDTVNRRLQQQRMLRSIQSPSKAASYDPLKIRQTSNTPVIRLNRKLELQHVLSALPPGVWNSQESYAAAQETSAHDLPTTNLMICCWTHLKVLSETDKDTHHSGTIQRFVKIHHSVLLAPKHIDICQPRRRFCFTRKPKKKRTAPFRRHQEKRLTFASLRPCPNPSLRFFALVQQLPSCPLSLPKCCLHLRIWGPTLATWKNVAVGGKVRCLALGITVAVLKVPISRQRSFKTSSSSFTLLISDPFEFYPLPP